VLKSSLMHLFFFPYHLKPPLPFDFTYFFYVIYIGFPLPFIDIMDECKQGNMRHTCLFNGFFWENIFWNNFLKVFKFFSKFYKILFMLLCQGLCKIFQNICHFQKNWNLFISFLNVKKHALQCLMNVFESFLFILYFLE